MPRETSPPPATGTSPETDTSTTETTPPTSVPETPATPTDSPENDTPPPTDTPAERFEQFCNENPGACG